MNISVTDARLIMGTTNRDYSDSQIAEIINQFTVLADMVIDSYMAKRNIREEETIESDTQTPIY